MQQFVFIFLALWATGTSAQTGVAFSAVKTTDQLAGTEDVPVIFDRIDVNLGGAFDGTTFTVLVQGLYLFTFTGFSEEMTLHLKVNGVIRRSAEIDISEFYGFRENVASNSVILNLNINDEVSIFLSPYSLGLFNTNEEGYFTQFSGALLYDSNDDMAAFSAVKTEDQLAEIIDTPISYDVIDTEIGGAFNGTTFVAPYTGLYLFTFAARGYWFLVELKVNDNTQRSVLFDYVSSSTSYYDNAFSNFMLLVLNEGDQVVTHHTAIQGSIRNYDYDRNTPALVTEFSGVFLNRTSASTPGNVEKQIEENVVAFSVTLNDDIPPVSNETVVIFDLLHCNIGAAFEMQQSKFTAPVNGYYLFTFSFKSEDTKVHLKVNNVIRRSAMRLSGQSTGFSSLATNSAILSLNQGDVVQLILSPEYYGGIITSHHEGGGYTQFSGVLLYEA